jgi:protein arginine N-methyltransferase 1
MFILRTNWTTPAICVSFSHNIDMHHGHGVRFQKSNVSFIQTFALYRGRLIEWMGYFLLRESMLDSLVRARDTFLKPKTGLMMPSHATMLVAPISDEEERRVSHNDYANAMDDWREFAEVTSTMYGVDMSVLEQDYDREQREYYVMSSRWAELRTGCLLADPIVVKEFDMHTCTVEDARGVGLDVGEDKGSGSPIDFDVVGRRLSAGFGSADSDSAADFGAAGPISGFAGWFTVDFKSRTDEVGMRTAPEVSNPAHLSTGPEMGCEFKFNYRFSGYRP